MTTRPHVAVFDLEELRRGPTAWLFEGGQRAGVGISMFVVRTLPGRFVELHVHPYSETFLLLEGHGRWTAGHARDGTLDRSCGMKMPQCGVICIDLDQRKLAPAS